jgi:hypothetical protein
LSSGANSDATTITIDVVFKEGTTAVNRAIDSLFLINHNLKNWDFYYWDGAAYQLVAHEDTDAAANTIKSFGSVTTSKVRLVCDSTQSVNAEKYIGEMIVCALQMDIGHDLKSYEVRHRERSREILLGDGSIHKMITRWTQYRTEKYECRAVVEFLNTSGHTPETERLTLKAIINSRLPFLWYPESSQRPAEIFLVRNSGPWADRYVSGYKGAGFEVSLDLREV